VDRPLFLALLAGSLTSQWPLALALGMVLELLWLDVLELGAIVAPFGGLSFLLLFPLACHLGLDQPGPLLIPLICALLAAYAAAWLERFFRMRQNRLLAAVEQYCAGNEAALSPGRAVWRVVCERAVCHFILYSLSYVALFLLTMSLQGAQLLPQLEGLHWYMLIGASLLGAVLSLRVRSALLLLLGSLGIVLCVVFWAARG